MGPGGGRSVKDKLNEYLKPHGLFFSPELSTSNRATIGGMVNTDASGQGSLVYGKTSDHVLELTAVLEDGSRLECSPLSGEHVCKPSFPNRTGRGRSIGNSGRPPAVCAPT